MDEYVVKEINTLGEKTHISAFDSFGQSLNISELAFYDIHRIV